MVMSHLWMVLYVAMCSPSLSSPNNHGWKSASEGIERSFPMLMTWPSGSSYDFSRERSGLAIGNSYSMLGWAERT